MKQQPEVTIGSYRLVLTCSMCPEQYDVFFGPLQVGYLRLRHGEFSVTYPDVGGEELWDTKPLGEGSFEEEEREGYLTEAVKRIDERIKRGLEDGESSR